MNTTKSMVILFFASFLLLSGLSINLAIPANTYAHPPMGLTPQPEPPPLADDDGGEPTTGDDSGGSDGNANDGQTPTDIIDIRLDQCGLDATNANQTGDLLAFAGSDSSIVPLSARSRPAEPLPEVLALVQLVHQGSGWIAAGKLSSQATTRFAVPYAGRWDVLLTATPKFKTAEVVNATGLNLAILHADVSNGPIALGQVEANVEQPQLVHCPIIRIGDIAPIVPVSVIEDDNPTFLPTTGQVKMSDPLTASVILMINTLLLSLMIFGGYCGLKSRRN